MSRYSASPPQTPAIIFSRFERVSLRGFVSPSTSPSFVHHAVLLGLVQGDPHEAGRPEPSLELSPYTHNDVFGRRVPSREEVHVEVQVPAVELADDALLDRALQPSEVHHVSGLGIDLPLDRHLEPVRVAVAVRVVALLEDPPVRLLVPVLAVEPVGGGEVGPRDEPDLHGRIIRPRLLRARGGTSPAGPPSGARGGRRRCTPGRSP